ncbi:MAG: DUF1847 domain-containing protein, partial [Gemmatimonadetes bacterium]|nr:DUF1847 domain-containing protein [Gemmatimonadota bacterium]
MPDQSEVLEEVKHLYLEKEDLRALACGSARTEADGYCERTRVEEIIDF